MRRPPAGPSPTPRSHHRHEPPRRGPGPDGHVPGLPPHLRDPRRRPAGHDARRRGPPPADRRPDLAALARRWSKAFAILFAVGAVSGTIISFELGLLWPRFTDVAGRIIGLPFSLEGFAFFLEAIFLGIYLYGWDRLSPRAHFLAGVPVAISGIASAFFIVTANAWMNVPRGFRLEHGEITHIDPVHALFNPAWPTETTHMVVGALLATAFGIVSVYAVGLLRGRRDGYHRKGLALGMTAAALLAPVQLGVGDLLGRTVAQNQPAKLAAFEGLYKTEDGAGINLGGFPVPGQDKSVLNIEIPRVLSVLAYDDAGARVRGLASFPKADRTPLTLPVRLSFLGMVGIGTYLIALVALVLAAPPRPAPPGGLAHAAGPRRRRAARVRRERARVDGDRVRAPAVGHLRRAAHPGRDHDRARPRRDLRGLLARVRRPRRDDRLAAAAAGDRRAGEPRAAPRSWRWRHDASPRSSSPSSGPA